ncbi:MAG: hypothetical protein WC375_10080 [Methanomassiliicoccales archaeon]
MVLWSDDGILLKWNQIDPSVYSPDDQLTISRTCWTIEGAGVECIFIHLNDSSVEYLDTNVQIGAFYEYDIGIWNGDFFEGFCGNKGFTYGGGLPSKPHDVSVTLYDASVGLGWKLTRWEIGGGEFESFDIYRSENGSQPILYYQMVFEELSWYNLYDGSYNYIDSNVVCGLNYTYSVKVVTTFGESHNSATVDATPGYAPRNIIISPTDAGLSEEVNATVSWIEPNYTQGIVGYRVYAYGFTPIILDNHTFNCSSIDFGEATVRVDSIYSDGRVVLGEEVAVNRPMGSCLGGVYTYLVGLIISIVAVLAIALVTIVVIIKRRRRR